MNGQGKLNTHIIFESVVMLFTQNWRVFERQCSSFTGNAGVGESGLMNNCGVAN